MQGAFPGRGEMKETPGGLVSSHLSAGLYYQADQHV